MGELPAFPPRCAERLPLFLCDWAVTYGEPREPRRVPADTGGRGTAMPAIVDRELCDACGSCAEVCPTDAIAIEETAVVNVDECNECQACADECPSEAITVKI